MEIDLEDLRPSVAEKWKLFLEIDGYKKHDKLKALDIFLEDLLKVLPSIESDLKQNIRNLNGISSILTRHFLVDVHDICLQSKHEDDERLLLYLVAGRGLKILNVLHIFGVRAITCNWDLANLLLSIMAAFQNHTANATTESSFAKALRVSLEQSGARGQHIPTLELLTMISAEFDCAVYDEAKDSDLHGEDFSFSNSGPVGNLTASSYSPSDAKSVLDCVFSLLEQLCRNDVGGAPSSTVSSMVLTVMLELLKKIVVELPEGRGKTLLSSANAYVVQKMVSLAVSTTVTLTQHQMANYEELQRSGIFGVLLQLAQHRLDVLQEHERHNLAGETSETAIRSAHYEIINCLLGCMEVMLAISFEALQHEHVSAVTIYSNLAKTFNYFCRLGGPHVLAEALCQLLGRPASGSSEGDAGNDDEMRARYALRKVVWAVGEFASHVRTSRLVAYHTELGERQRCIRKSRKVDGRSSHHHALCRSPTGYTPSLLKVNLPYDPSECPVGVSISLLLRVLAAMSNTCSLDANHGILKALGKCGICCCLDLCDYFEVLLTNVRLCPLPYLQEKGLRLLEGAISASFTYHVSFDCGVAFCEQCKIRLDSSPYEFETVAQHLTAGVKISWRDMQEVNGFWNVLKSYLDVLISAKVSLLQLLERHLNGILAAAMDNEMRLELFVRLFVPLLMQFAQPDTTIKLSEELMQYSFRTTAALLDVPRAYTLLVSSGAIDKMFNLMCSPSGLLRQSVLRLLVRVMLEEAKLEVTGYNHLPAGEISKRIVYRNIILNHTVQYRRMLGSKGESKSQTYPFGVDTLSERLMPHYQNHMNVADDENYDLLYCLVDLWKTLCFFVNHSGENTTDLMVWSSSDREVMEGTILALIRCKSEAPQQPDSEFPDCRHQIRNSTMTLQWDLFGCLLHVLATCENAENDFQVFLDKVRLALKEEMIVNNFDQYGVGCMFHSLLDASLTAELSKYDGETTQPFDESEAGCNFGDPENDGLCYSLSVSACSSSASEEGYDGDNEEEIFGRISPINGFGGRSTRHRSLGAPPSTGTANICHPNILRLLLDLAVAYHNQGSIDDVTRISNLSTLNRDLLEVCKASIFNCNIFIDELGVAAYVLSSFRNVLLSDKIELSDLQEHLLDLFATCACRHITTAELQSLLKLLVQRGAPVRKLHSALESIVHNLTIVPQKCVYFFSSTTPLPPKIFLDRVFPFKNAASKFRPAGHGEAMCDESTPHQITQFQQSPWCNAAIIKNLPALPENAGSLLPFDGGLTVAFWINLNSTDFFDEANSMGNIHLFSCGFYRLFLEVWLIQSIGTLFLKISSNVSASYIVLATGSTKVPHLKSNYWQHLIVSWRTIHHLNDKTVSVKTTIYVNSLEQGEGATLGPVSLLEGPVTQHERDGERNLIFMLGHSSDIGGPQSSWSLGPLMIFVGHPLVSRMQTMLYTAGPDCVQIELPGWSAVGSYENMEALRKSLLASFLPQSPDAESWNPAFRVKNRRVEAPLSLVEISLGGFAVANNCRLDKAIARIGGAATFIVLLASTIELHANEEVQALCLSNIVSLTLKCPSFDRQFKAMSGWDLVMKILSTPRCIASSKLLSVLLNACTSEPVLQCLPTDRGWHIDGATSSTIINVKLLMTMLKNWQIFHRPNKKSVLSLLLKSTHSLISHRRLVGHSNLDLMGANDLTEVVLAMCRDRAPDGESQVALPSKACHLVVDILKILSKSGHEKVFSELRDFLVLSQPLQQMFVCHNTSSFYFLPPRLPPKAICSDRKNSFEYPAMVEEAALPSGIFSDSYLTNEYKVLANEQLKLSSDALPSEDENMPPPLEEETVMLSLSKLEDGIGMIGFESRSSLQFEGDSKGESSNVMSDGSAIITFGSNEGSNLAWKEKPISDRQLTEQEVSVKNGDSETTSENVTLPDAADATNLGIIFKGILEIVCEAISTNLPEREKVLSLIDHRLLIVLALHQKSGVRESALRLIKLYVEWSSDKVRDEFIKMHIYHLLGSQLHQHESSRDIVKTCFGIVWGPGSSFFGRLEDEAPKKGESFRAAAVPLVLALIPRACCKVGLGQDLLQAIIKTCCPFPAMLQELFLAGLTQSLCLAMSSFYHNEAQPPDQVQLLLNYTFLLLSSAMVSCVHAAGNNFSNNVRSALLLISQYELSEVHQCGTDLPCVLAYRDLHCTCLFASLNSVLEYFGWSCHPEWHDILQAHGQVDPRMRTVETDQRLLISDSDLKLRFTEHLFGAVDFLWHADVVSDELSVSRYETTFARFLLGLLMDGTLVLVDREQRGKEKWHTLIYGNHGCFRSQLGRMLVFLLSPTQQSDQKMFILKTILGIEKRATLIVYVLKQTRQLAQKFCSFLHLFLRDNGCDLNDLDQLLELQGSLKKALTNVDDVTATADAEGWLDEVIGQRQIWIQKNALQIHRILSKLEKFTTSLGQLAIEMSSLMVATQDDQRKMSLSRVNRTLSERMVVRKLWQKLVVQSTHERALWHRAEAYPQSWQLDQTEGPHRVRKRLERCQLTVEPRFLMPEFQAKLQVASLDRPLAYLFQNECASGDLAAINEQIQNKEKITFTYRCTIVTPSTEARGDILFGSRCLYYIGEESYRHTKGTDVISHRWHFEDIIEIHKRRFELQNNALELFLVHGRTYLIAFVSEQERNALHEQLIACNLPNLLLENENQLLHTLTWRDRSTTNFEYLTQLNKAAGRSFNDLMQYPVFPFILSNYSSKVLNLTSPKSYRNLCKPMAIQDVNRESYYISQYKSLEAEQACNNHESYMMPILGPCHYGSHYSNSGIVLHFLVRLPPFTSMFLSYQDRNFDIPDRTFHSVHTSWRLSSSDSNSDVKEIIPEFFYLPEFLTNSEGFNFGVRQTGDRVDDVALPDWCRRNPRLFVLIHRQALESAFVTGNLHHWIDLVFGYKQTGKAAVDSINVFHPATYYGFDVCQIQDTLRREAMRTMIKTFGQTPRQLFRQPHPLTTLSLTDERRTLPGIQPVMPEVEGLRWGIYSCSLDEPEPSIVWQGNNPRPITTLVSMVTNEVFGLEKECCLLAHYCKSRGANMINTTYVENAALVMYGFADSVIRLQLSRERPFVPFLAVDPIDPVTCCGTIPDCPLLFLGKCSGGVSVYRTAFDAARQSVVLVGEPLSLFGHNDAVTDVQLCKIFGVAVTASQDSTCIIWDLNRLEYVRSITEHRNPVHAVKVSDTSGDIASFSDLAQGSRLLLHTINAKYIGSVELTRIIRCICFSCAPEGTSVNVLCAGLDDGTIMMWSSWDLKPVREIFFAELARPILCLAYSLDCQHLYASNSDGVVFILESTSKHRASVQKYRTVI